MPIRGLLFDIGDTLIAATQLQQHTLEQTAEALAAEEWIGAPQAFVAAYRKADAQPAFDETADLNHLYSDARIVALAFELLALPVSEAQVQRFLDVYRRNLRENIHFDPVLDETLAALRSRGVKLGIVSNGTTLEQLDQLERLGVRRYFDPILISQQVGVRKPDSAIFLPAARQWKLPPHDIAVVGDRADWDIAGGQRVGMQGVLTTQFVDTRGTERNGIRPEYIIRHFNELPELVRSAS